VLAQQEHHPQCEVASYFRRSKEFGITHDGFTVHMPGVRDRKRKMVSGLNDMYMENYRKTGAEFILGTGRFIAPRTGFSASSAALADVNGDAKPDLLEANESSNSVGVLLGNGFGAGTACRPRTHRPL
jgi:pyruvate/2-oxoglutarate dehydrogenase complex dihydrolipoamide dehydrogenase (E3) component